MSPPLQLQTEPPALRWNGGYEPAVLALVLSLAALFLSNQLYLAQYLHFSLVLPLALLAMVSISLVAAPTRFSTAIKPTKRIDDLRQIVCSMTFWAVAVYLAALFAASISEPDAAPHLLKRELMQSVQILTFVWVCGLIVLARPPLLVLFFTLMAVVVAASALLNMIAFVQPPVTLTYFATHRLKTYLGMPEYINSTNISATYAVFFIGAAASAVAGGVGRLRRSVLAAAAAVLFIGVLMTQSRNALLAILVGICAIAVGTSRRTRVGIALAALLSCALILLIPDTFGALTNRGLSYRPEVWHAFLEKAVQHPLLGYGQFANINSVMKDGVVIDQAHNIVLSAQIRGGLVAAAAMLLILGAGLFWSFRFWWISGCIIPFAVFATMATLGTVDYEIMVTFAAWPHVTFWLPIGLCIGAEIYARRWTSVQRLQARTATTASAAE